VSRRRPPDPCTVTEVALDAPLRPLDGARHGRCRVLVRLHGHPVGVIDVGRLEPRALAERIRADLGDALDAHLRADGLAWHGGPLPPPPAGCAYDLPLEDEPLVSVVVPTRGRSALLERGLVSVLAGRYRNLELLVVDNAPEDGRARAIVEAVAARDARIRYAAEPRAGAAAARNRGLQEARGRIAAFLDDDVIADGGWLRSVAAAFGAASDVACVTSLIMPLELETPAQLWLEEFGGFAKGFRRQIFDLGEHRRPGPLYPYTVGAFGSGAAMAFDRALLQAGGGFDERLARGGEDLDVFLRLVLGGHRLVYEPAALVWHRHPAAYRSLQHTMFGYGAGLTAVLAKRAAASPDAARDIASCVPAGLRHAIGPASAKNAGKGPGFPRELGWRERAGMLAGPFLFTRAALKRDPRWT
jgi:O-antigen biosynthesis protein